MRRVRERRWFPFVLVHSLLIQCLAAAFRPALAYAMVASGAPLWWLALLAASFAVPALLLALPIGRFVDVYGERPIAVAGALLVIAGAVLGVLWHSHPVPLVIASLLVGAGHLPSVLVGQAQVAHRTSQPRLDAVYGHLSVANAFGQLLGPLLLMLPGGTGSLPPLPLVFGSCLGLALALFVAALLLTSSAHEPSPADEGGALRQAGGLLRSAEVVRALLVGATVVGVLDVVQVYWPAIGVGRGFDVAVVSTMLSVRAIASMVSRVGLSALVRRFGRPLILLTATIGGAVTLAITALPVAAVAMISTAAVFGAMLGVCLPLSMAWLAVITPQHNRGVSMSLRLGANRLGQILVPMTLGLMAATVGAGGVVLGSAGVLLASAVLARSSGRPSSAPSLD